MAREKVSDLGENSEKKLPGATTYFHGSRAEIARSNLSSLKVASYGGLAALLVFLLITPYLLPDWHITREYWMMIPSLGLFALFVSLYDRFGHCRYGVVQITCMLFYVVMALNFIDVGVFAYTGLHDAFMAPFFVLMPVLFIIRPWAVSVIMVLSAVLYGFLAYAFKTPEVARHDVFCLLIGLVFGHAAMYIIFRLRINDFLSREKYKRLSQTDLLTGLLNKRSYEASCQSAIKAREAERTSALFVFDVDDFKIINDTFGHVAGDNVLEMIGKVLRSIFRSDDLVGRIGGDEFSAYIQVAGGTDAAALIEDKAEQILSQVRENTRKTFKIEVTMSIGVCVTVNPAIEYREMYLNADRALYAVKQTTHDGWKMKTLK